MLGAPRSASRRLQSRHILTVTFCVSQLKGVRVSEDPRGALVQPGLGDRPVPSSHPTPGYVHAPPGQSSLPAELPRLPGCSSPPRPVPLPGCLQTCWHVWPPSSRLIASSGAGMHWQCLLNTHSDSPVHAPASHQAPAVAHLSSLAPGLHLTVHPCPPGSQHGFSFLIPADAPSCQLLSHLSWVLALPLSWSLFSSSLHRDPGTQEVSMC